MLLPILYANLDPQYRQKLIQLEKIFMLAQARKTDTDEHQNYIVSFFNQFMMPLEFWTKLFDLANHEYLQFPDGMNTISKQSIYQFYFEKCFIQPVFFGGKKIYDWEFSVICYVKDFCYPHPDLDKKLDDYEKHFARSLIPKSIYRTFERMKVLYSKIKAVEKNVEEWFKVLLEVKDEKFIEDNIEYRIGRDLTNKKLWKMYIKYLKENNNQQKLIQTYSKYCRFFLDDSEMLEEYRNTVGEQKVSVPWTNPFEFEHFDETFFDDKKEFLENESDKTAEKLPLKCHFNSQNASPQKFPFKQNLIYYILKTANAYVLYNLYKSCKWFYLKNPVTVCYKIVPNYQKLNQMNNFQIEGQTISISDRFPEVLEKIFISTSIELTSKMLPNIFPKIYRCTAKYISIAGENLSYEELNVLMGSGNVEDLKFWEIKDSKNEYFVLEDLLKMVPKIKNFIVNGVQCTPQTSETICKLPFENTIYTLGLTGIKNGVLEPNNFCEFVKKHVWSNCGLTFEFVDSHERAESVTNFKETVEAFIEENWKNPKHKPCFYVYFN